MSAIYEPKGAAREYAPLAVNLFSGCLHGCRYCYVPGCLRKKRVDFHAEVQPRTGIIAQIEKDLHRLRTRGQVDRVHLCFTCDPYPAMDKTVGLTREALIRLRDNGFPVSVLTKAGLLATRDFDLLATMDSQFGVTLAWHDDGVRADWEPGAASVEERLESLRLARARGIYTWVSVEPVIDPDQGLAAIEACLPLADMIKVGRWNHDSRSKDVDWRAFAIAVKAMLVAAKKPHVLKRGLAEFVA